MNFFQIDDLFSLQIFRCMRLHLYKNVVSIEVYRSATRWLTAYNSHLQTQKRTEGMSRMLRRIKARVGSGRMSVSVSVACEDLLQLCFISNFGHNAFGHLRHNIPSHCSNSYFYHVNILVFWESQGTIFSCSTHNDVMVKSVKYTCTYCGHVRWL